MKVALCTCAKNESKYINEWINHYINLEIAHIYIYNNDDKNDESLYKSLKENKNFDKITIIDIRGELIQQTSRLTSAYKTYGELYDYMLFVDVDEFLILDNIYDNNINNFLSDSKFKSADCIRIPWMVIDDNDLVTVKNNNYSITRFSNIGKFSIQCKSICKTKLNIDKITPHGPLFLKNTIDSNGNLCNNKETADVPGSYINDHIIKSSTYIKHYIYKTIQEFIEIKLNREESAESEGLRKTKLSINDFFNVNKITEEKLNFLKSKNIIL